MQCWNRSVVSLGPSSCCSAVSSLSLNKYCNRSDVCGQICVRELNTDEFTGCSFQSIICLGDAKGAETRDKEFNCVVMGELVRVCVCACVCVYVYACVMLCLPSANQCSWQRGCWDSSTIPNRKWSSDLEHKHTHTSFLILSLSHTHKQTYKSGYFKDT